MNSFMKLLKDETAITEMMRNPYGEKIELDLNGTHTYEQRYGQLMLDYNAKTLKRTEKTYHDDSPEYIQKKLPDSYKDLPARCYSDPLYENHVLQAQ